MSKIKVKEMINKEARELAGLLHKAIAKADQITSLYTHLGKAGKANIEYAELNQLISLCENHNLESLQQTLLYLTLERIEGRLYLAWNDRYRLNNACGMEFTCGSSIEIFIDRDSDDYGWNIGRVEYQEAMGGYYFLNKSGWENHRLEEGMKVAVRKRAY